MSKPPEPSASSRAWTFTRTSSPSATGPVSRGYATHGAPSTSRRASPSCRSTTAVTRPRRRLSIGFARNVDECKRHVHHAFEILDSDALVWRVDVLHPVREVQTAQSTFVEDVRVGGPAAQCVVRADACAFERGMSDAHDIVIAFETVAAIALLHFSLDLAILETSRERDRVEHLLDDILELALVVRPRFREKRAPLGHDVAGGTALDDADVRGRLLVDPPEPQVGDRARGGRDRGTAVLRIHARMRRPSVEAHLHRMRMRRTEDDLPDWRGLVEHVAHARRQSRLIECGGAEQTNLLFRREEQLDSRMRTVLCENATRRIEHRRNRRLVVGSEDRVG